MLLSCATAPTHKLGRRSCSMVRIGGVLAIKYSVDFGNIALWLGHRSGIHSAINLGFSLSRYCGK